MGGVVILKLRVIPNDVEINLDDLLEKVKKKIEEEGGKYLNHSKVPIGFGLSALDISFSHDEKKFNQDEFLEKVRQIDGIDYAEIISVTLSPF